LVDLPINKTRPAGVISTDGALTEVACKEATMANTQSSSPFHSPQIGAKSTPAPVHTTSLVEQQLRLSVESPQLLAAIEILLPLAKAEYRELSGPRSSTCDPRTAELIKSEAEAWFIGIALAEDALARIKPCPHLLVRYFHQLEKAVKTAKAVQP